MNFKESQQISTNHDGGFTPHYFSLKKSSAGFTLIELVAVIAVMVIISAVVLVNYTKFGNSVLLTNLAYDISLSIRQAQQFGTAVRGTTSGSFDTGYGVHFDNDTSYILFADIGPTTGPTARNKKYDSPLPDETVEGYTIRRGSRIDRFCGVVNWSPLNEQCSDTISHLDIVFDRPQPGSISNAFISSDLNTLVDANPDYISARIVVINPQGETREVRVESTGQISVQ